MYRLINWIHKIRLAPKEKLIAIYEAELKCVTGKILLIIKNKSLSVHSYANLLTFMINIHSTLFEINRVDFRKQTFEALSCCSLFLSTFTCYKTLLSQSFEFVNPLLL